MMKPYLESIIKKSLAQFGMSGQEPDILIERPRTPDHGDLSTNVALTLPKLLRQKPRAIAQQIVDKIEYDPEKIQSIEIAGPGFINFRFAKTWLFDQLRTISHKKSAFGSSEINKGKRILIEFVSANPTGPLTVGHGRNAVLGDTLARLFEWTGAKVEREYYFNDAGRQMRVLAQSVRARYLELTGGQNPPFPEDGYQGEYIRDIARHILDDEEKPEDTDDLDVFRRYAQDLIFQDIQHTLERMNIRMDTFFNERDLYSGGAIDDVVRRLRDKGLVYEQDDATWFKTTEFGKDKDTVLIKSSGEPTYRLPDIAYHLNKLQRGYDLCVDVFGADHIATYPDVISAVKALGYDTDSIEVLVYQFVTLVKDGKPYKMSTRKANFVTLDELMDEVGSDVTRFFFLMRSPGTHLEFDIGQAREAGEKNPVFYLQYAHARIKSIMRKAGDEFSFEGEPDLSLLAHETEISLIKTLLWLPEIIRLCTNRREPHHLITYLNELASDFTQFYHHCHILGEAAELAHARAVLADVTSAVLANGLEVLGIHAPDRM